ncbi:MAG: TonB-dependent receptor [Bacteroidales bacterium]|nr:TonB-dependent receptor [Bacteroidales bacterium]
MKKFCLIGFAAIILFTAGAQPYQRGQDLSKLPREGVITGKVRDLVSEKFVEYATIAVFSQRDSSLAGGTISQPDGSFTVNNLPYGMLYLEASFVGYKKTRITKILLAPQKKTVDLGVITIEPSATSLEAVEVVAERPQIEYKIDKKVITVDQNIVATGGTAVDVLENTPSVQVDIEGNVSLRGSSSFTVLIDGKPSVLEGSEALQQLPTSTIQSIEIITNPSAKYDPEGSAGIINVIMKKQKQSGINGIIDATVSSNGSYGGDVLFNLRKNKINYFLGGNYHERNFGSTGYLEKQIFNVDTFFQIKNVEGTFHRDGIRLRGGFDYNIDSRNTISLSGRIGQFSFGRTTEAKQNEYYQPARDESLYFIQDNDFEITRKFYELALDYQLKLNENGHQLQASVTYEDESSTEKSILKQDTVNSNWKSIGAPAYQERTFEDDGETEFRAKIDYTLPFSERSKFEAGYQADYEGSSGNYRFQNYNNQEYIWMENDSLFNDKDFNDIVHALYATYSNGLGKLFDYQVGLRVENNDRVLIQNETNERYTFNRWDLFPGIHISKQLPKSFQVQASYTRRINRPGDRELDPFRTYMDPYTSRVGNPGLKPEYTNSYELNVQKNLKGTGFISMELFHRQTNNLIDRYTVVDTLTRISTFTFKNIARDYSTGAELMINMPFAKWWNFNASSSFFSYSLKDSTGIIDLDKSSFTWGARFNSTFRFNTGTQVQLMGFYRAPSITSQGERRGFFFTNLGIRQEFFSRKLIVSLQVRDILGMAKFEDISSGEGFYQYHKRKRESQIVRLSVSYKINNYRQRERRQNGQDINEVEYDNGDPDVF